ncbi:MAG: anhydro-N-acetylmuramic acid kinase [Melioribacteraceae bacterium]|nr:anhydro-N-acetylmuramic acid kinase [Melioribacteraceae bacterium]
MLKFVELTKKEKKIVVGLMSGTSLDGVDVALVEITGNGTNTKIDLIGFIEYPFPEGLKSFVLKNSVKDTSNVEDICRLNFLFPQIYFDAVKTLCEKLKFDMADIDLIGSHGQTIHHLPQKEKMFGYGVGSTLQIGDPSALAKLTGVTTVGDFRTADIAFGGQGAPLVPYFDYILFHSNDLNRALLNIGGISNFTILNKDKTQADVLAFDTGPGNMIVDLLMRIFYQKEFDANGDIAKSGKFNEELFNTLVLRDNFIEKEPPKSTGREYYGEEFLEPLLKEYKNIPNEDFINTVTNFTAYSIFRNYEKFVKDETEIDELFVSGGGARNLSLLESLKKYFGNDVQVKVIDEIGISSDAKEAICFAVLANETVCGNHSNIPRTTGASESTILGKICL